MAIVSDEQVIKVLRQYNPWWRNPLAIKEENKPQKRLAYYEAFRIRRFGGLPFYPAQGVSARRRSCIR